MPMEFHNYSRYLRCYQKNESENGFKTKYK